MRVMAIIHIVLVTVKYELSFPTIRAASGSENESAANAEPNSEARVMATCMVERNLEEFFVRRQMRFARLFPSSASFSILVWLAEITAISALAKMALRNISTTCNDNASTISPGFMIKLAYSAYYTRIVEVETGDFFSFTFYNAKKHNLFVNHTKKSCRKSKY